MKPFEIIWTSYVAFLMATTFIGCLLNLPEFYWLGILGLAFAWAISELSILKRKGQK
jgi:hypothetical protein